MPASRSARPSPPLRSRVRHEASDPDPRSLRSEGMNRPVRRDEAVSHSPRTGPGKQPHPHALLLYSGAAPGPRARSGPAPAPRCLMRLLHRGMTIDLTDDDPRTAIIEAVLFGKSLPPPLPAPEV